MTNLRNPQTHALTRVWLRTTDLKAPLRAVWQLSSTQSQTGKEADLLCA